LAFFSLGDKTGFYPNLPAPLSERDMLQTLASWEMCFVDLAMTYHGACRPHGQQKAMVTFAQKRGFGCRVMPSIVNM
jgi:hypothetical protein